MNTQISAAINNQIKAEFSSAYAYLAMSSYFSDRNLDGFTRWTQLQAQEEIEHGMKLFHFLHERDERTDLKQIEQPKQKWESALAVFQDIYKLEQEQSKNIGELLSLAISLGEHTAKPILHWFLEEQVQEEATAKKILEKLEFVKDDSTGILFLDKELGARLATPQ